MDSVSTYTVIGTMRLCWPDTLNRLSKPVEFNIEQKKALKETLNQLFARSYHFLFNALAKAEANQQTSQVLRQQLVCDHLDIVDEHRHLNWGCD